VQREDLTRLAESDNFGRLWGAGGCPSFYDDWGTMELREFFSEDAVKLGLEGTSKDDILKEMISLLKLDEKSEGMLFKMLKRRENLGSTGIGRSIAIPHCRSLVVNKLRVAFGRKSEGVDFKAIDEKPVKFFFLIVAPPARGVESVPPGPRQDRPVQQGTGRPGQAPRARDACRVHEAPREKGV
jgi:mannitol/fructose-specific phosphotransferase system IIA component (Ntr-type)